jgi:aspartate/methionine/tyrosine aminotransferase
LHPPDFALTAAALEAAITPATRLVIVNDPVNPTGRRLTAAERDLIAEAALAHDLFILADEVWEEVRPPGTAHHSLLADPRVAERVVKLGSAGKIFELTGWKVGWALARGALADRVAATHQFLTFTTPPALQLAVAEALAAERPWIEAMRQRNAASRARLAEGLASAGWAVLPSEASWFLCVDLPASGIDIPDRDLARRLVERHGVAAIPVSSFYESGERPRGVLRFCHAKAPATIDAALARLAPARVALAAGS